MSAPNTLLVNGVDLRAVPGLLIAGDMNLYAPGVRRGSHITVPGRRGQVGVELPYDAYQFSITVIVQGASRAEMAANLIAFAASIAGTNGLVTLERHLANMSGGIDSYTASGQFAGGTALSLLNDVSGQTDLVFVNLDGAWTPDLGSTWVVP